MYAKCKGGLFGKIYRKKCNHEKKRSENKIERLQVRWDGFDGKEET